VLGTGFVENEAQHGSCAGVGLAGGRLVQRLRLRHVAKQFRALLDAGAISSFGISIAPLSDRVARRGPARIEGLRERRAHFRTASRMGMSMLGARRGGRSAAIGSARDRKS